MTTDRRTQEVEKYAWLMDSATVMNNLMLSEYYESQRVPTWHAFGAPIDPQFESWQGHSWAYIMIPLSDEWCEDNDVVLNTCYVEGSMDVVNRKWLVHNQLLIDWIEKTPQV